MGVEYTDVARVFDTLPDLKQDTELSSAHVVIFIEDAEAVMNAKLRANYEVPITGEVPLLTAIATDCSIYRILSRRIFTQERLDESTWPDRYKECEQLLDDLADGSITLVDSAGAIISSSTTAARIQSNTAAFHPTFWEGGDFEQNQDSDKITDERNRRI